MRIYASATSVAPLLNGLNRFVETTTDISGVSSCPFERLILLGVTLNAFIILFKYKIVEHIHIPQTPFPVFRQLFLLPLEFSATHSVANYSMTKESLLIHIRVLIESKIWKVTFSP